MARETLNKIHDNIKIFHDQTIILTPDELNDYLCLDELNDRISRKSGKIGEFEREFFLKAFIVMLEEAPSIPKMDSCWKQF